MRCPQRLPDGRCATSRQPAASCPVHAKRKSRRGDARRSEENRAEVEYWAKNRCTHRGDSIGSTGCATCVTAVPAFSCELHGKCTELRRATDRSFRWCGACSDYSRSDGPTIRPTTRPVGTHPVAIVIPCHNYGRYLAECLESALATGPSEVLVVDDASTDDTAVIADSFAAQGVRYLRVENQNVYRTRLDGMAATSARFVVFLDADDVLPTDYLDKGVPLLADPSVGVVYSDMQLFGDSSDRWTMPEPAGLELSIRNHIHAGCLVRRAAIETTELPPMLDTRVLEDWNVWRRIKKNGWKFQKSPAVYKYRQHGSGRLGQVDPQQYRVTAGLDYEPITLFVPLSGRAWAWPQFRAWLDGQTWPRELIRLVLCDTSQDARFHALLRRWVDATDYPDVRLYTQDVARPGVADADRHDGKVRSEVQTAVASIYRRAVAELTTDYAVIVEDDIVPPVDAISRLMDSMNEETASVSAAYPHRFESGVVAWHRIGSCLQNGSGVVDVGGNGFGCVLLRSEVLRRIAITTDGVTPDYDIAWYQQLRETKWRARLDWSIRCEHLEQEDAEPTRFIVLAQPRTGSTLLIASLNRHPEIQTRGEVLNAGHCIPLPDDGRERVRAAWERIGPCSAAGFKVLAFQPWDNDPEQWATGWDEIAGDPFVKVIVLRREDQLAQFASWKVANTIGRWKEQQQENRPVIDVSPDELRWFKQWNDQLLAERLRRLDLHDKIEVTYEQLTDNWQPTMERVQQFLGVPVVEMQQATTKQEPRPLDEVIQNLDQTPEGLAALA